MTPITDRVKAWAETVTLPTYGIGQPDKNPMFLEKRVYQGSSGVVYPYPVIDRVLDEKTDQAYTALFLENRYLKVMILPEIGGRVQMAQDKTNGYHFVYYNRVIKPALVGLAGPWLSGGIEFNWPQHHRPSTFEPVDWHMVDNTDGSKTVWCSEIERMFFTKGMHGFTLHPERAYLEINVQLYNRTSEPQTFLWWANPAVHVNDNYQSVFPPDVYAVMDHGKRDVSDFPIATGTYYKVNYAPGTDISRYKNIPVPTSYMAHHSDFDFVGDYDHGQRAGMLHVANHHTVPGKKQWTWGHGDFGQAWDRQLTDEDGPYIELMCGAFTDNQPDFSWLMPGEEKRFTQIFMPYKLIGPAKNASRDAVVNLEFEGEAAKIGVYVTQLRETKVELRRDGVPLWERASRLSPEHVLIESVMLPANTRPQQITLRVADAQTGGELVSFTPLPDEKAPSPAPATAAKPPSEMTSNEELFLNGLHLEQYRHATYAPEPYYEEALRRDPFDSRCNNALGLLLYRRGKFSEAEPYFRKAIESLTRRNPNPYDGEPYYNLGLSLKMQGRYREALGAFYKSAWNAAWQDAAYFELARLTSHFDYAHALELADNSLRRNWTHHQARHLKIALLRRLSHTDEALKEAALALELDVMNFGVMWERRLLAGDDTFTRLARGNANLYIEVGLDYMRAGLFGDAITVLEASPKPNPMTIYFLADCYLHRGDSQSHLLETFKHASAMSPDYCFPHRLESVSVLQSAMEVNPTDARAPYYLGNFWYAHRRYAEAIECWEKARDLDPSFPTTHRNLGLAYFNKRHDRERARAAYERAFALNPDDARVLFELDQLEKRLNRSPQERLTRLEQHLALVERRDDLTLEYVTLLNRLGRHAEAYAALTKRKFHPWEGGEGKTTGQYVMSLVEQAKALIASGKWAEAVEPLERAFVYPHNLGEGKLLNAQENNLYYYFGLAYAGQGDAAKARACFEKASAGLSEPTSAMYYNDQPPDMIFYQGLARQRLGRDAEARQIFQKLVDYGQAHLDDDVTMDYFAVSLPAFLVFDEDLNQRNRIHCHYVMGLGQLGLGNVEAARQHFNQVLALDANHQGAMAHRTFQMSE
jgi:tetratricopeptide (TPR) repeat protein